MTSIYKKLQEARIRLQATKINKSGTNQTFAYFELTDFLPQIQSIFNELGLTGVISFGAELAELSIYEHEGSGKVVITSPMSQANLKACSPVQNLGAAQTYLRRYLWISALEIVVHDELEATTGMEKQADYAELLKSAKNRSEFERAYKSIPESRRKEFSDLAKEIGAKYPKLTEVAA